MKRLVLAFLLLLVLAGGVSAQTNTGGGNAVAIQNVPVSPTGPLTGQCLVSPDGLSWAPGSCSGSSNFGFGSILSGTNTTATMTISTGATWAATAGGIVNLSAMTGVNNFRIPVIAGAAPTTAGALAYNSTNGTLVFGNGGATLTVNTTNATVSSVALTLPSWLSVSGSPIITAGTLAVTPATGQTSGRFIGTCGAATSFAPCAITSTDLPGTITSNTSGSAAALSTVITLANTPLTTNQDILFDNAGAVGRLPIVTSGTCLGNTGGVWASVACTSNGFTNPMTTLGDTIYGAGGGSATRLAGSTSATMAALTQTGTGSVSAAPAWTAYVGGGTNPVAATVSAPADTQQLTFSGGVLVNTYTGTNVNPQTANYTMACPADRNGEIEFNISAATTLTIPQAGSTACFGNHNTFIVRNADSSTALLTLAPTTSTFQPENVATKSLTPGSGALVYTEATTGSGNYHMILVPPDYGGVNTQTGNYTVGAGDRNKLIVMNCSAACTLTFPATAPTATFSFWVETVGSTGATIALNGRNFNGGTSAPVPIRFMPMSVKSDGTNFWGDAPLVAGANTTFTPTAGGVTIASTGGGTNAFTTLGDLAYGGVGGTPTRLPGPTSPNGIPQSLTSTPSGGVAVAPAWGIPGVPIDAQTGTSYTIPITDDVHFLTGNNAAATAWTGFSLANNYVFSFENLGAGLITYTPASGTVNGNSTQVVPQNWFGFHYTDNTNTFMPLMPTYQAFPNCTNALQFSSTGISCGQVPLAAGVSGLLPHANIASTAVSPGSYNCSNITVAADGSLTSAANGSCAGGSSNASSNTVPAQKIVQPPLSFNLTSPTTIASTASATSMICNTTTCGYSGRQYVDVDEMTPYAAGVKTVNFRGAGTLATAATNFGLTVKLVLGGVTVGTITVPTTTAMTTTQWDATFQFTITGLTTATFYGCMHLYSSAGAETGQCSSGSASGLNFAASQTMDIQATWQASSASNTITTNQGTFIAGGTT